MKGCIRWLAVACALAFAAPDLAGAQGKAGSYRPPVEPEPASKPSAFFGKDARTGQWCAFDKTTFETRSRADRLDAGMVGWIRVSPRGLDGVTVYSQSEDAAARDEYAFAADGRVTRLVRTGGYIDAPSASLIYQPGPNGRLTLTPPSREVLRRMGAAGFEHYIEDWPTYGRLSQVPFAALLDLKAGLRGQIGSCAPR